MRDFKRFRRLLSGGALALILVTFLLAPWKSPSAEGGGSTPPYPKPNPQDSSGVDTTIDTLSVWR